MKDLYSLKGSDKEKKYQEVNMEVDWSHTDKETPPKQSLKTTWNPQWKRKIEWPRIKKTGYTWK